MTELVSDICRPSELIVPVAKDIAYPPTISGALFISGAKLYFTMGATAQLITSA